MWLTLTTVHLHGLRRHVDIVDSWWIHITHLNECVRRTTEKIPTDTNRWRILMHLSWNWFVCFWFESLSNNESKIPKPFLKNCGQNRFIQFECLQWMRRQFANANYIFKIINDNDWNIRSPVIGGNILNIQ